MDEEIVECIGKFLEQETKKINESDEDNKTKARKLHSIMHLLQIMERYDELEPVIQEYLNKEAEKRRFENCDR
ncbi:MAG: hypothetical protein IJH12_06970 [Clostridia bacterium]|nr:hypothetical protein [Clostridia bacterium]